MLSYSPPYFVCQNSEDSASGKSFGRSAVLQLEFAGFFGSITFGDYDPGGAAPGTLQDLDIFSVGKLRFRRVALDRVGARCLRRPRRCLRFPQPIGRASSAP